jgi:predicted ribosome quality control (RQC) complex YloA/Tae2 family protein
MHRYRLTPAGRRSSPPDPPYRLTPLPALSMITPMNSLTVYALGFELDRTLAGSTLRTITRFRGGATLSFECPTLPYLHVLTCGRKLELVASGGTLAPRECSAAALKAAHGARITRIRSLGLDRVLIMDLDSTGTWNERKKYALRIDMTGSQRNFTLFLLPDNRLVDSLCPAHARKPSHPEQALAPRQYSILTLAESCPEELRARFGRDAGQDNLPEHTRMWDWMKSASNILVKTIDGVDPVLAQVLSRRAAGDIDTVWAHCAKIGTAAARKTFTWHMYDFPECGEAGRGAVYPVRLPCSEPSERFDDFLSALKRRGAIAVLPSYAESLKRVLTADIRKRVNKLKRLESNLANDLADAQRSKDFRLFANLLLTHRHKIKPGLSEITVRDFSGEGDIRIPLSPSKNQDENIRSYFVRAKKGEKGLLIIKNRRSEVRREIDRTRALLENTRKLQNPGEILKLFPPANEQGKSKGSTGQTRRFKCFPVDGIHTIYVGKNDKENDELTHRFASPGDMWFHAQGVSGSHVILKGANASTPVKILKKAAAVAAYYSKARHSKTVPVIYTEKRYVRKPRKSRPGTALYQRGKTLFISPELPGENEHPAD